MLEFEGTAPKDLIGKTFIGTVAPLLVPVAETGMKPWDRAEKRMQAMYTRSKVSLSLELRIRRQRT
jgi:hypothetical protein